MKSITLQTTNGTAGENTVAFSEDAFEALIEEKGYRVIHEKVLQCPCKSPSTNQQSTCRNCGGTGWIFINPYETKMVISNMNETNQFKSWSKESQGQAGISVKNIDRLCFMDRITLIEAEANFNEVRFFKKSSDNLLYTYCSYHIKKVEYVGLFSAVDVPLIRLVEDIDFTFDGNRLYLTNKFLADYVDEKSYSVTIRYVHQPQYHIIDIQRQVAYSRQTVDKQEKLIVLPLHGIGRRAHFILDADNITTNRLVDNSYLDPDCRKQVKVVDSYSQMC